MKLISERNEKIIKNITEKNVQESDINHLKNAFEKGTKISKMFWWEIIFFFDFEKIYIKNK